MDAYLADDLQSTVQNGSITYSKIPWDNDWIVDGVEVILYRVICELINNSLKHAACSSINLSLSQNGTELALDYTDDGRGFNPQAMMDCGMGLSNISSRINSLGGVFDIASAKGRGMRAAIRVNTQEEQASQRLRRRKRK